MNMESKIMEIEIKLSLIVHGKEGSRIECGVTPQLEWSEKPIKPILGGLTSNAPELNYFLARGQSGDFLPLPKIKTYDVVPRHPP